MALRVEKLLHRFGKKAPPVLEIEAFELPDGAERCLVGGSGSGKTTFLNVVAGIVRPTAGRVVHGEIDILALGEAERDRFRAKNVGFVFQTFNLLQGLSALENLLLAQHFAGERGDEARGRCLGLLGRVGLAHRVDHKPAKMSVGEQQRVAVARAVVNRPPLILADEPTANLDEEAGAAVLDLLREVVREQGASLLLVTHEPAVRALFSEVTAMEELSS